MAEENKWNRQWKESISNLRKLADDNTSTHTHACKISVCGVLAADDDGGGGDMCLYVI